ncbi:hypothetical protein RSJ42_11785 [Methanosarcina hadiensis]|uniref:hypothetical protein n=1 Tax=Methanosarcina hadiensis TaxID=3078083 RepID=UPI003977B055
MDQQKTHRTIRKFCDFIERSKERQAYSDFKEGINKGLQIAKNTFHENAEKFVSFDFDKSQAAETQRLQDKFNLIIDSIVVQEKPNHSQDHLDGIYAGFERSKELFGEFIKDFDNA